MGQASFHPQKVPGKGDPHRLERAHVQVVPTTVTAGLGVGAEARCRGGEGIDRLVEEAHLGQPPDDVPPAEAARDPRGLAAGEHHLAPGLT